MVLVVLFLVLTWSLGGGEFEIFSPLTFATLQLVVFWAPYLSTGYSYPLLCDLTESGLLGWEYLEMQYSDTFSSTLVEAVCICLAAY